jgi:hypothetical protein
MIDCVVEESMRQRWLGWDEAGVPCSVLVVVTVAVQFKLVIFESGCWNLADGLTG